MIDDGVWSTGLLLHSVYKLVQDALQLILSFDPAQKRIQVSDRNRPRPKIFDPSSSSQIHLWSKSQILRPLARLDGETGARAEPLAEPLAPPSQISNRLTVTVIGRLDIADRMINGILTKQPNKDSPEKIPITNAQ